MILVTGAGGKTGRSLIKALTTAESVCALVHRAEDIATLESLGAEKVIVGDMLSETVIRTAMKDMRAVYHICPNMSPVEAAIGQLVINEARRAEIQHFVYHSVLHPQVEKMNHHWQKMRVEEMLFESGLPFTILQPAPYMQNLLAGWKRILEEGILSIPYSIHTKFSFVDLADVAEAARNVLTEPIHLYAIYELAGTWPISHREAAELFALVLKRDVRAETEAVQDWKLRVGDIRKYTFENLSNMFDYYDRWGLAGNPNVLRWLLKREPISLEVFAQKIAGELSVLQ
jgi:uncharacterized protein YbjT (DUF2867 family)